MCIATGGSAVKPPIPGAHHNGVFTIRNEEDQRIVREQAKFCKSVVVVGASFIGSESAAALKNKYKADLDVYLVAPEEFPLQRVLGDEVGKMMTNEHLKKGVRLTMQRGVKELKDDGNGNVKSVVLDTGDEIECQMVILGTGIRPNTKFLHDSGIQLAKDGGVVVDPFLSSSDPNIYAAGDVA